MTAEPPTTSERPSSENSADSAISITGSPEWLDAIRGLIALAESSEVREVTLGSGELRVRLRRAPLESSYRPLAIEPTVIRAAPRPEATTLHEVRAPLTGIWYDAPSPGGNPYVQVGSHVEIGSLIGLIETMKIFNEISADAAGRVAQIHVRRADLVQVDTPLVSIDTADTSALWPHRA